MYISPKYIKVN